MSKNHEESYIRGVSTRSVYDELVLTAVNEAEGHPNNPDVSADIAIAGMRKRFNDMLRDLQSEVAEATKDYWNVDNA